MPLFPRISPACLLFHFLFTQNIFIPWNSSWFLSFRWSSAFLTSSLAWVDLYILGRAFLLFLMFVFCSLFWCFASFTTSRSYFCPLFILELLNPALLPYVWGDHWILFSLFLHFFGSWNILRQSKQLSKDSLQKLLWLIFSWINCQSLCSASQAMYKLSPSEFLSFNISIWKSMCLIT